MVAATVLEGNLKGQCCLAKDSCEDQPPHSSSSQLPKLSIPTFFMDLEERDSTIEKHLEGIEHALQLEGTSLIDQERYGHMAIS